MDASPKTAFFTSLLYCAGITLFILLSLHVFLAALVSLQHEKNIQYQLLIREKTTNILPYEKRQGKIVDSEARLSFIATLRRQNEEAARILKELYRVMPNTIHLTLVQWQNRTVTVKGSTAFGLELVALMDTLKHSSVLAHPVIAVRVDEQGMRYFEISMGLKP
ncbi:MAG TPA: PilN domain-containing protein [Gammaproteobacteria bacterium]|nr:PilN domain-containing protein [Gammaproteobacteria bacterium]